MSAAKPLKPVPDQYKLLTEDLVKDIGKKAETLMSLAGELGNDNILLETGNVQVQIFKTTEEVAMASGPSPRECEDKIEVLSWTVSCKKCEQIITLAEVAGNTLLYYQPRCIFCGQVNHVIGEEKTNKGGD